MTQKILGKKQINPDELIGFLTSNGTDLTAIKHNLEALAAPTGSDNFAAGYFYFSVWIYGSSVYICVDDGSWLNVSFSGHEHNASAITAGVLATARGGVPTGGTTGQVLKKNSSTDNDVGWDDEGGNSSLSFEVLSGTKNNSNKVFTFTTDPGSSHLVLYNGLLLHRGVDYTRDEEEITLSVDQNAPGSEDELVGITFSAVSLTASSSDDITNASGVSGPTVTSALNNLDSGKQDQDGALDDIAGLTLVSGDILYVDGSSNIVRLPKGTDDQLLSLASGFPAWVDAPGTTWGQLFNSTGSDQDINGTAYIVFQDSAASGITVQGSSGNWDGLVVPSDGIYKADYSINGYVDAGSASNAFMYLAINGNSQGVGASQQYIGTTLGGQPVQRPNWSGSAVMSLDAGDEIQLRSAPGTADWRVMVAHLTLVRIA